MKNEENDLRQVGARTHFCFIISLCKYETDKTKTNRKSMIKILEYNAFLYCSSLPNSFIIYIQE